MAVKDGDQDRSALFFCSRTVALNRLVGLQRFPFILDHSVFQYERETPQITVLAQLAQVLVG
jgi:metallo-beta-lactamase class B